jgi:hypothetical protein
MVSKSNLMDVLDAHANNLRLVSVLRLLARQGDLEANFRSLIDGENLTRFQPTIQLLNDKAKLIHSADQLYLTVIRSAVTESFDLTRKYCESTSAEKTALLKSQSWFHMFRTFRNAFNHDFRISFRPADLKLLPFSWGGLALDFSHNNEAISLKHLPLGAAIDWLNVLRDFVSKELN